MRIDQYLPGFAPHDAIGNHTLQTRRVLREAGYESDIFAEHILHPLEREAKPYLEDPRRPGEERVLLFQTSTSSPMSKWLQERAQGGERLIGHYHNITPAQYFARWEPFIASAMEDARQELAMLAPHIPFSFADSGYNAAELEDCGYKEAVVCPLLVDIEEYHQAPDPAALDRLRRRRDRSGAHWLFVGRVAPNKCQHDVIGAFAVYRRVFDPGARLTLVGGATSPNYLRALERMIGELELGDSVEILNGLGGAELLAHWAVSDVFVCLSEHEGFCVPLLEAMELGVPVVAYAAAAVPETLAGAGVLLADKDPLTVAEAVDKLCQSGTARGQLVKAGRDRAANFSLANTSKQLLAGIEGYLAS
jgi:glycosyltransferase involved in cell wall biosynthesis